MMRLSQVAFHPVDRELIPKNIELLPRTSRRLTEVLLKGTPSVGTAESPKSWSLQSCLSPTHFLAAHDSPNQVASTQFQVTRLNDPFDPLSRVEISDDKVVMRSDAVFRSVGYRSISLPGFADAGVQFDERRGVVDNDGFGRVTRLVAGESTSKPIEKQIPGLYCSGWLKRGPTGVIASTMQDAFATGDAIAKDWMSGIRFLNSGGPEFARGWEGVKEDIGESGNGITTWDQWKKIDKAEKERGSQRGKKREKFTSTAEMLGVLG